MSSYWTTLMEDDSIGACISQTAPPGISRVEIDGNGQRLHGSKVIHDRVHDQMLFHGAMVAIMDTPEFQRLRDLHQLGNCRYLFPGAVHTRFEHSLGVSHLAQRLMRQLKTAHHDAPGAFPLEITPADELCVAIAGLCHDLGHGPLSHMFEGFVNDVRREKEGTDAEHWAHEDASIAMFRHLLKVNHIDLQAYEPALNKADVTFIEQLIRGLKPGKPWPAGNGREPSKRFLFDIVCNKRSGIDVDKLDYFLRDNMCCYGKLPDIHVDRILTCARVIEFEGEVQLAFEEKVALSLSDLFTLRAKMHKFVYQHRVVKIIDHMTQEALLCAERGGFTIQVPLHPAADPEDADAHRAATQKYTLSESVTNMYVYAATGDWVFNAIAASSDPRLSDARAILRRIRSRQLYKLVGYCNMERFHDARQRHQWKAIMAQQIRDCMHGAHFAPLSSAQVPAAATESKQDEIKLQTPNADPTQTETAGSQLATEQNIADNMPLANILVVDAHIVFGSSGEDGPGDPITNVRFFNPKWSLNEAFRLPPHRMSPLFSPQKFEEHTAFVYSRDPQYVEELTKAFHLWKRRAIERGRASEPMAFVNSTPGPRRKAQRVEHSSPSRPFSPTMTLPTTPPPPAVTPRLRFD